MKSHGAANMKTKITAYDTINQKGIRHMTLEMFYVGESWRHDLKGDLPGPGQA